MAKIGRKFTIAIRDIKSVCPLEVLEETLWVMPWVMPWLTDDVSVRVLFIVYYNICYKICVYRQTFCVRIKCVVTTFMCYILQKFIPTIIFVQAVNFRVAQIAQDCSKVR